MNYLTDLDPTTLDNFIELLRRKCPRIEAIGPTDMATEEARANLLFNAGRASVLKEFEDEKVRRAKEES